MLSWLLRILLVILLVRALLRFVRGLLEGASVPSRPRDGAGGTVPLVKDPVCGTYVVKQRALTSGSGDEVHYFCSERCRDAYLRPSTGAGGPERVDGRERAGRRTA